MGINFCKRCGAKFLLLEDGEPVNGAALPEQYQWRAKHQVVLQAPIQKVDFYAERIFILEK